MQRLGVTRRHDDVAKRQNHEREHHPCHGHDRACAFRAFPLSPAARRSTRSSTSSRATTRSASSRSPKRRCRRPPRKGRHRLSAALYGAVSVTLKNAVGLARIRAQWPTEFFRFNHFARQRDCSRRAAPRPTQRYPCPRRKERGATGTDPECRQEALRRGEAGRDFERSSAASDGPASYASASRGVRGVCGSAAGSRDRPRNVRDE